MMFWLLQRNHTKQHSAMIVLPPVVFFVGVVILLFDNAALIEDSSNKVQFSIGVWLLLAGICWLWSARQQSYVFLNNPGTDHSSHFILSGLFSLIALCFLAPLSLVGEGEWRLFNGDIENQNWLMYWVWFLLQAFWVRWWQELFGRPVWLIQHSVLMKKLKHSSLYLPLF